MCNVHAIVFLAVVAAIVTVIALANNIIVFCCCYCFCYLSFSQGLGVSGNDCCMSGLPYCSRLLRGCSAAQSRYPCCLKCVLLTLFYLQGARGKIVNC